MAQNNKTTSAKIKKLPQKEGSFLLAVRKAPVWIGEDEMDLVRPFIMLLMDEETGVVLGNDMPATMPAFADIASFVFDSIENPLSQSVESARPKTIWVENEKWVSELKPYLENAGIGIEYHPQLYYINDMLLNMEAMSGGGERRGLLSMPGITPDMGAGLYKAAAAFFKAKPWQWVPDSEPIEIRYPLTAPPSYAVVMGNGGETFGLAGYESLEDIEMLYSGADPFDIDGDSSEWISLMFDTIYDLPFQDIDAIADHAWEIADPNAYPFAVKFVPPDEAYPYNASDLAWMTAVLQVLPDFVTSIMKADKGDPQDGEKVYTLTGTLAGQQIALRYPTRKTIHSPEMVGAMSEMMDSIYDFVEDWEWESGTPSERFALEMGSFMVAFLSTLQLMGATEAESETHYQNMWAMGAFICDDYAEGDVFSPEIFLRAPAYVKNYKEEISKARRDVQRYEETWRELGQFVRDMGLDAGTSPMISG